MKQVSVHFRSFLEEMPQESHSFAQIALPVAGSLEVDVDGHQSDVGKAQGAFIHRGVRRTQQGHRKNLSLIVDIDQNIISERFLNRLDGRAFLNLTPTATRLVEHLRRMSHEQGVDETTILLWVPLLLDHLCGDAPEAVSRLAALRALIEIEPFQAWSVEQMAGQAGVSASRLHALFREVFNDTPHAFLAQTRIKKVCDLLVKTEFPLVEIAYRAGFSDQTALTRAMRNSIGMTPAAYRFSHRVRAAKPQ